MSTRRQRTITYTLLGLSGSLVLGAIATKLLHLGSLSASAATPKPLAVVEKPKPFAIPECKQAGPAGKETKALGNPQARGAAQRGLNFLMAQTQAWQKQHNCFGCHVHAVTLEALSVGNRHQYLVPRKELQQILTGLLDIPGGARTKAGLSYHGDSLFAPSKAFGGAAFARYDQWVDKDLANDLIRVATELLTYQQPDGSIRLDWVNVPVGVGAVQGTYQAIQTWQQAYARSADDRWLTAVNRGEAFLQATVKSWANRAPEHGIQEVNYAIMGLLAAGVGGGEPALVSLKGKLLSAQHHDGGWGFHLKEGEPIPSSHTGKVQSNQSSAYPTGQTLYTLRLLGMTDKDSTIERGMQWLIAHQLQDGGWSQAGFGKAEAMWGVLGLVSLDVLTVSVSGLTDGQHVDGTLALNIEARDNDTAGKGGVRKIEILVDDIPTYGQCGSKLSYNWQTAKLAPGKHIVQVNAINNRGQTATRTLEVFAGPVYLTQIGSRFENQQTHFSLRNIAPEGKKNRVEVRILAPNDKDPSKGGSEVAVLGQDGKQGPMAFAWDGKGQDGKAAKSGKYLAQFRFRDDKGKIEQTEEVPFVHDTEEAQRKNYAEVQGQLALPNAAPAANAELELVDEAGRVVSKTKTTAQGQYRFRNVDAKKYKLRVVKEGYEAAEMPFAADKAQEKQMDLQLRAK